MTKPKSPRQWGTKLPQRSTPLPRGKRPRRKPRTPEEDARIYGPPAFRTWLRRQSCAVCGYCGLPSEAAHSKTGGMARKDDWTRTLPLCRARLSYFAPGMIEGCHRELHRIGVKSFEQRHGVTLLALIADAQQQWQAVCAGGSGGGGTPA